MTRRLILKALPALCLPLRIRAQQSADKEDRAAQVEREAEAAADKSPTLPVYPRRETVVVDAPFFVSFTAKVPSKGYDYPIHYWRRSDGSVARTHVLPQAPLPIRVEVTGVLDYSSMKSFVYVTVDGVLSPNVGVVENAIRPDQERSSGVGLIESAWKTLESEESVVLDGVDDQPCKRLLLESPSGSQQLEVWISEDLGIILKEELRLDGVMQHLFLANTVERSEPDSAFFEPPFQPQ